ncbi:ATP-grasp domain-containing protein [Ferrovibrio sp.]|uniref:ATP-grasp domain-containing protein n=1 Tax=Ferrovibrio sp. TaxID=1917215 RepID=UPI000CB84B4D|nr:ATP-grasp domain-containing protein [Ferrovibrio sp.]PJI41899.1 MAG: hypothetical protein CTR53_05435 [Ferrovibrio sp.]
MSAKPMRTVLVTGAGGPGYPAIYKALHSSTRFSYRIIGAELNPLAGNLYRSDWVDAAYQVPPTLASDYFDCILDVIRREGVTFWYSAVDEELPIIAANAARLAEAGCGMLLPPPEALEASFDKGVTTRMLSGKVPMPRTLLSSEVALEDAWTQLGAPMVVKACRTRGNRHNYRAHSLDELKIQVAALESAGLDFLYQEQVDGEEFNVSLMMDANGNPLFSVARQKIDPPRTRANTFCGIIRRDAVMEGHAVAVAREMKLFPGMNNVEFLRRRGGEPMVIDVNGGRHAAQDFNIIASGVNFPEMLIDMAQGLPVSAPDPSRFREGTMTVKFVDDMAIHIDDLRAFCHGFDLKVEE